MQRNSSIKSLDGARGVAAILVAIYHFTLNTEATRSFYLFVDLFFILSGYVMIRSYGEKLSNQTEVKSFIFRRLGRLYPLHVATMVFGVLLYNSLQPIKFLVQSIGLGGVLNSPGVVHTSLPGLYAVVINLLLLQGFSDASINGPSWSISVEFFTYIIFALAMCWLARKWHKPAFVILAVSGTAFTIAWSVFENHCLVVGECIGDLDRLSIFRCIGGFFTGVLIFELNSIEWMKNRFWCGFSQIAFLVLGIFIISSSPWHPGLALFSNIAFAGLIISLQSDTGPVAYLLSRRFPQFLGKISYSIYLCHWSLLLMNGVMQKDHPVYIKLGILFAYLLVCLCVASLMFRFIEEPFRIATRRIADRRFFNPLPMSAEKMG